ncbi:MAG: APC family permease [Oscillospiraceae bacterium]|nr:APC family permease [Oscillospiraceae bacterium]
MEQKLTRKYGLLTAICMVVGTVIGSGIFFRNESIIAYVGGNMWAGIAAWLVGGFIALSATYVFGVLATKHEKVGGLVDFGEALLGERYAYLFGWFMATMFYPTMSGVLAWVSARFTVELFGWHTAYGVNPFFSGQTYALALFYLVAIYAVNVLSQKLSGKFQVSTTFIKVIPLLAMGIIGTVVGLSNGTTIANLQTDFVGQEVAFPFFYALVATAFAYLGWDSVLSINSEIKNSKRNLPVALVAGLLIIMTIYALYFIGIFSAAPVEALSGSGGVLAAFTGVFSDVAGTVLFVFIVISCLGTLNGLSVGGSRAFYILAARGRGMKPEMVSQVDKTTNMPHNSAAIFLVCVAFWMLVFSGNFAGWYGEFNLDLPGLVPVFFQFFLIPVYVFVIFKEKSLGFFNRFCAPLIATIGGGFLVFAANLSHPQRMRTLVFGVIFLAIMTLGALFYKKSEK